ncbi:hypothetical protein EYF80_014659 [Liparis tanakae]|uniref:Uncharacterized protein n=1 Tax=Liparis tanakae TaxID=230148 RepID=A0A4Z2IAM6_9TELE|nr:hypothetical protein EYF80_014659 [Liparis tanakae]
MDVWPLRLFPEQMADRGAEQRACSTLFTVTPNRGFQEPSTGDSMTDYLSKRTGFTGENMPLHPKAALSSGLAVDPRVWTLQSCRAYCWPNSDPWPLASTTLMICGQRRAEQGRYVASHNPMMQRYIDLDKGTRCSMDRMLGRSEERTAFHLFRQCSGPSTARQKEGESAWRWSLGSQKDLWCGPSFSLDGDKPGSVAPLRGTTGCENRRPGSLHHSEPLGLLPSSHSVVSEEEGGKHHPIVSFINICGKHLQDVASRLKNGIDYQVQIKNLIASPPGLQVF